MSLKTMTVSKLKDLKRQVEAAIHAKVTKDIPTNKCYDYGGCCRGVIL